jgi:hypothetical protein
MMRSDFGTRLKKRPVAGSGLDVKTSTAMEGFGREINISGKPIGWHGCYWVMRSLKIKTFYIIAIILRAYGLAIFLSERIKKTWRMPNAKDGSRLEKVTDFPSSPKMTYALFDPQTIRCQIWPVASMFILPAFSRFGTTSIGVISGEK